MTDFFYDFNIRIEGEEVLPGYAQLFERFPLLIPKFAQRITLDHEAEIIEFLSQTPGQPVSPWPWVSKWQKEIFFATYGFGEGIPHERGGEGSLEESWFVDVEFPDNEVLANVEVGNSAVNTQGQPYMNFVDGWAQQPGFAETGWFGPEDTANRLIDVEVAMVDEFTDLLNDALQNWRVTD